MIQLFSAVLGFGCWEGSPCSAEGGGGLCFHVLPHPQQHGSESADTRALRGELACMHTAVDEHVHSCGMALGNSAFPALT